MITFFGAVPVIINPAIRMLSSRWTRNRVEMLSACADLGATRRYFAGLGIPLVNTVTSDGPRGTLLDNGSEVVLVSDQPETGSTRK